MKMFLRGRSPPVPGGSAGQGGTHLPIPEVAAAGGLEHEDVVGVEGRGTDGHLEGLGVVLVGAVHLEEAGGGHGLRAARPRGAALGTTGRARGREVTPGAPGRPSRCSPGPPLTVYTTILPLKMAIKCAGSLPMVTRTCTGSLLYFWSRMTAW